MPQGGLSVRLGPRMNAGCKLWEWRVNTAEQYLLHYSGDKMDVYEPAPNSRRKWRRVLDDCDVEILGQPCSVRTHGPQAVSIAATSSAPVREETPQTIQDKC